MQNLKANFDRFFDLTKFFFKGDLNADDNFLFYPWKSKIFDCELIAPAIMAEFIGVDSENYFFCKLQNN